MGCSWNCALPPAHHRPGDTLLSIRQHWRPSVPTQTPVSGPLCQPAPSCASLLCRLGSGFYEDFSVTYGTSVPENRLCQGLPTYIPYIFYLFFYIYLLNI